MKKMKMKIVKMIKLKKTEKRKEESQNNDNIICVICQRKFKSAEKLALHEKLSELHKQNLIKLKLNNN